jgi:hypothetical protein
MNRDEQMKAAVEALRAVAERLNYVDYDDATVATLRAMVFEAGLRGVDRRDLAAGELVLDMLAPDWSDVYSEGRIAGDWTRGQDDPED